MSDSQPRYRERRVVRGKTPINLNTVLGTLKTFSSGTLVNTVELRPTGVQPNLRFEKCWDYNNSRSRGVEKRNARGSRIFRTGGPFTSIKVDVPSMGPSATIFRTRTSGINRFEYKGFFTNFYLGFDSGLSLPADLYQSGGPNRLENNGLVTNTSALESRAWDIKPKIEKASFINALYEFKDVPGQLRQTGRAFKDLYKATVSDLYGQSYSRVVTDLAMPDRIAGDYLNVHFGWIPFCKDIAQMCDFLVFSKQYLEDISHGNNTWLKRKGTLIDEESQVKLGRGYTFGCEPAGEALSQVTTIKSVDGNLCRGYFDVFANTKVDAWAEGAFKYYRPEFDVDMPDYSGVVMSVNRHITAMGLRINPIHVWKAIPWSWCVDWFSNVGKIIERASDEYFDSMVTKYLYLMHRKRIVVSGLHRLFFSSGDTLFETYRTIDVKQRVAADSPYGFVLGGDLSATQWSILGALGLANNVKFTRSGL